MKNKFFVDKKNGMVAEVVVEDIYHDYLNFRYYAENITHLMPKDYFYRGFVRYSKLSKLYYANS
jgi:hypothetical protein